MTKKSATILGLTFGWVTGMFWGGNPASLAASPVQKQSVQKSSSVKSGTGKQTKKVRKRTRRVKNKALSPALKLRLLLKKKGLQLGDPVFIRLFKKEAVLELWMRSQTQFTLVKSYPVCKSSGHIGPKLKERDYQSPEGFYSVGRKQMKPDSAYHRAFNIGFPNKYDRAWGRTGSLIMVHGACRSVGCFAMTNTRIGEIYKIVNAALLKGQEKFQVHIFPFRMSAANMDHYKKHKWKRYWWNLKEGYDIFEHSLLPPIVSNEGRKYVFTQPTRPQPVARNAVLAQLVSPKRKKKPKQKRPLLTKKTLIVKKQKPPLDTGDDLSWKPFKTFRPL